MYKIQQFILYPTFLSSNYIDAIFTAFIGTVQVTFADKFVDTLSAAFITSSQIISESSVVIAKYSPFSQLHVAGFQISYFLHALCSSGFLHSH